MMVPVIDSVIVYLKNPTSTRDAIKTLNNIHPCDAFFQLQTHLSGLKLLYAVAAERESYKHEPFNLPEEFKGQEVQKTFSRYLYLTRNSFFNEDYQQILMRLGQGYD